MKNFLCLLFVLVFHQISAQQSRRLEILFLGDNGHHKPIERVPELMAALGPKGINVTYTDNLDDINPTNLNKYDALMIYANWDLIPAAAEKALLDFVASGKGFLPIHCASYCFRNSPDYVKLVGGQFWRHKMDSVRADIVQPGHPIMQGLSPFTAYDETYLHNHLEPDNNVLETREIKADQASDKPGDKTEPYTWTRTYGKGKIFYTAYGHDERTWSKTGFQDLIFNAIKWVVNEEAKAAFDARNPEPFRYHEAKLPNYEKRSGVQLQQKPLSPEESMKHIQIPVEFNLELFASEPDVMHPIALTWDEKGRLYVLITKDYPNERKPEGGSDYILLCEDTNADGKADKFTRFAEGLSIPTGMVFGNGGLIVSQAPDMLFFKDTDGDDKADLRKTLFTGFGTRDTHAGPSNLHYGFDNWIWGCVGYSGFKGKFPETDSLNFGQALFRFKPDGSKMEWMTTTSNNTWGMAFNETNEVFGSTANNSHGWYMAIPHSFYNSTNRVDNGSRSTDTHRDMKPITEKVRQVDVFGGFTAASGHNFYTARAFPEKYWNKIAFVSEPTGHILHQNHMVKNGTDYSDKESFNLMAGADEWFSPVFSETGPDGAVWVADWYSFIIQHNPTPMGFENGTGNAYDTDLRDYTHGRIYRVSSKEAPEYTPLSLSVYHPDVLLKALENDNMFWRMQSQRLLVERGNKDVVPQLVNLLNTTPADKIGIRPAAVHALWTLKGLGALTDEIINQALKNPGADVRNNAVKAMDFSVSSVKMILENNLLNDAEPLVVMNALLVLSKSPLDQAAETVVINRILSSKEAADRWLPDAFACVLTANDGYLMKKYMDKLALTKSDGMMMDHSMHGNMGEMKMEKSEPVKGVDLMIEEIQVTPMMPEARERIGVVVKVKNNGTEDFPADVIVPLDLSFEGQGIITRMVSRNYKNGIKAGETVAIDKNLNGPWVGNIGFYTDIAGEYTLSVDLDKNNDIKEVDEMNNQSQKKVMFKIPSNMSAYALQRAVRSFSSLGKTDELSAILRNVQSLDNGAKAGIYKAMADGWNYKLENVSVTDDNKSFLTSLRKTGDLNLDKLLNAWKIAGEVVDYTPRHVITIETIEEAMKYTLKEFKVKAGEEVELVFVNPDAMQHNLVITQIKAMEIVGAAADKMITEENAAAKSYVPAIPEVLFSTPLVDPGQTYKLRFKAPTVKGNYPFVCTFPGHWRLMNGVMKVVK